MNDIIEKSPAGVYVNNPKNKKLGRVGARYGTSKTAGEYYGKTVKHFKEYSNAINNIASELGGVAIVAPPKKLERVQYKAKHEYGGDFKKVKDILRSTIVIGRSKALELCDTIRKKYPCVKAYVNFSSEGYQGANFVFSFKGFPVELQVNTPVNMVLKQGHDDNPALKNAYDMINSAGIPTGLGHKYYEKLRQAGLSEETNTIGTNLMNKYYNYRELFMLRDELTKASKHGHGKKRKPIVVYNKKTGKTYTRNQIVGDKLEEHETKHPINEFLRGLTKLSAGKQAEFFKWERDNAKYVEVNPISDLPQDVQDNIWATGPKIKECFGNSARIAMGGIKGAKYVEGFVSFAGVIPLEHAWVKIGDKYYDPTAEGPLKGGSDMGHYTALIELNEDEVLDYMVKERKHGPWVGSYYYNNNVMKKGLLSTLLNPFTKLFDKPEYPENICKSSDETTFKNYADCILVNEKGQLLLLLRADGDFYPRHWCLPGGKIEQGETQDEGALRELLEETNIKPVGYNFLREYDNGDGTTSSYYEVHCSENDLMILDNSEHYNWCWVDQVELEKLPLILSLQERLVDLLPLTTFGMFQANPFTMTSIIEQETNNISPQLQAKHQKEDAAYYIIKTAYDNGQLGEAAFLKASSQYTEIKKGRPAQIGEIREWGGVKKQKTANGWVPVKSGKKGAKVEDEGKDEKTAKPEDEKTQHSEEELAGHAQNASEADLKKTVSNSKDEKLRVAAQKELQRRTEQSDEITGKNKDEDADGWAKKDGEDKKGAGGEAKTPEHDYSEDEDGFHEQVSRARKAYDNPMDDKMKDHAKSFLDGAKDHKKKMGFGSEPEDKSVEKEKSDNAKMKQVMDFLDGEHGGASLEPVKGKPGLWRDSENDILDKKDIIALHEQFDKEGLFEEEGISPDSGKDDDGYQEWLESRNWRKPQAEIDAEEKAKKEETTEKAGDQLLEDLGIGYSTDTYSIFLSDGVSSKTTPTTLDKMKKNGEDFVEDKEFNLSQLEGFIGGEDKMKEAVKKRAAKEKVSNDEMMWADNYTETQEKLKTAKDGLSKIEAKMGETKKK